jgi:hypothetical protein
MYKYNRKNIIFITKLAIVFSITVTFYLFLDGFQKLYPKLAQL